MLRTRERPARRQGSGWPPPAFSPVVRIGLLGVLLLLGLPLLPGQRLSAQARVPNGYEEGLFDVSATGIAPWSVPVLVTPRGKFLLPLRQIVDPLGVPTRIAADSGVARLARPGGAGTASVWWGPRARLELETSAAPLDPDDVHVDGAQVYLAANRLAELLEAAIDVDVGTLTLRVQRAGGFPAQIKLDARQRRRSEATLSGAERDGAPTGSVPFRPRSGAGVVEWAVGGPLSRAAAPSSLDLRGGVGLHGGMLQLHGMMLTGSPEGGVQISNQEVTYRRVFPGRRWLQQVQLGSVLGEGAEARPMHGLTVTNAPFVRGLQFDDVAFSRPLPPGWEYEVYEGARLVGFADGGGSAPMTVPLRYGTTPLRVKLYGPAGEVEEASVSYVIPVEQLRAKEWQYAAGAGRCVQQCSGLWYADLRHGVSRSLTLQAGMDARRDSGWNRVRPYGAVSFLPSPGWTASLQARRASYIRGSVQSFTQGRLTGGVTAGLNLPGQGGVAISSGPEAVWFAQSTLRLRGVLPGMSQRALILSSRLEAPRDRGITRWDLSATMPTPAGMLETGVQSDPFSEVQGAASGGPVIRVAPTIALGHGIFRRAAYPVLRMEAGLQRGKLVQWEGALSAQPGRSFVSIGLRHAPGLGGTQLTVGGSYALGLGRVIGRASRRGDQLDGGYSASGAVAFGSVRRATPLEYGGLGLSGVEGHVFRDVDGDGRRGPLDEAVQGVRVRIGGLVASTDARGRYSLWNVLPYEAVYVQIDTLSLEDPAWVPALPARALRPSPQQFTRVEFGLVRTREVTGMLVAGQRVATPAGVGLELRDAGTGELHTARSFSDGAFYFSRVRPGRYRLTVASSSVAAMGVVSPAATEVTVAADGSDVIELPAIGLQRSGGSAAP